MFALTELFLYDENEGARIGRVFHICVQKVGPERRRSKHLSSSLSCKNSAEDTFDEYDA